VLAHCANRSVSGEATVSQNHVYRFGFDASYQSLTLADASLLLTPAFQFDSTSKAAIWKSVDFVCVDDQKPEPDFWKVNDIPTVFICNERVLNEIPVLWARKACEALPIRYNGHPLWLCNITEYGCYDALDVANCTWPSGIPGLGLPLHYSFFPTRLGPTTILTVPETCEHELYVHEYTSDPVYEFKADVKRQKMTGLVFEEIWSAENASDLNF
jgi:hypothetical protein